MWIRPAATRSAQSGGMPSTSPSPCTARTQKKRRINEQVDGVVNMLCPIALIAQVDESSHTSCCKFANYHNKANEDARIDCSDFLDL